MQALAQKLREGLLLHRRGDLPAAESCLRQALDLQNDDIDTINLLAMVLAAQKKYGEAARLMQRAIEIRPQDPVLLGNLGGLLNEANDPLPAIRYLREAIRMTDRWEEIARAAACEPRAQDADAEPSHRSAA